MDIRTVRRAAELLSRLSGRRQEVAVLPMRVQKAPFPDGPADALPRAVPESVGIQSGYLQEFLKQAAADKTENLHSLTVLRHGKVIAACSFAPFDRDVWHVTHSLCKTVTGLCAGILIGDGLLSPDERVVDLFPEKASPLARIRWRGLLVRHLLNMTSGASLNEVASVTQMDWVRGFLDSTPQFEPGREFQYNSMNSYMLSAIICKKTGKTLTEFLEARLFGPMGIRNFHWETCPLGIEKGGWGLYLKQEDMAKLGLLVLRRGEWAGRALVPADYIGEMSRRQSEPPESMSDYGYGFQCWLWARPGSVLFNGLFGQNILVIPELDMVIASNAGRNRMFGKSSYLSLCERYFGAGVRLPDRCPPDPRAYRRLCRTVRQLEAGALPEKGVFSFLERLRQQRLRETHSAAVAGRRYVFEPGAARLLPLFVQLLENNYTTGISAVCFSCEAKQLYITFEEGEERNTLEVGFSAAARGKVCANGEEQLVAVSGVWTQNEDGVPVLKLDIAFLEQASTRHIKLFFDAEETVRMRITETPSKQALQDGAAAIFGGNRLLGAFSGAVDGKARMEAWLSALAEPELTGRLEREEEKRGAK